MEYCFLKCFLAVLLIQHCTSEGLPTPNQSLTVTLEDAQAIPQEPELPPAEIVPVVAPPSLKDVQQAMQEASEQVEGRGAEEVLKELLERVVEATLGQVEGGSEGKVDEATGQEGVEDEALGDGKGEIEANTVEKVLDQAVVDVVDVVDGGDVVAKGGLAGVEEEQTLAEMDAHEVAAAEEVKGVKELEGETAAGSVEEATLGVETGSRETVGQEVITASLEAEISQGVVEGTVAAVGGGFAVDETVVEANNQQVEEKGEHVVGTQEAVETPAIVEVTIGGGPEQETVSDSSLGVGDMGQLEDVWGMGDALEEETQVEETEGELVILPSDNYEMETTQSVVGEPVEEEEINIPKDIEGQKVEDEQDHLVVEGGPTEEAVGAGTVEVVGGDKDVESVITEESEVLVNEGDVQQAEEEQITVETTHGSEKDEEDPDVTVISAPEPEGGAEASIEQSPENQAPAPSPSLGGVETEGNHGNEIITPTDDLLPHDPVVAEPTPDHFVNDAVAVPPQAEGEANELVEDSAETTEAKELGLEAWKIGAITAAVFLVLETLVIIIYILKCRKKNSTQALQRACEEGCVEPEAATGGDCSDDTLPAGNEDTQQIAPDPSDVASALAHKEQQEEEQHVIAMSDLPTSPAEESASSGPGPDSSQDLRTSIL